MRVAVVALVAGGLAVAAADARPPAAWVTVTGRVVLPANVPVPGPKFLPGFAAAPDETVLVDPKTRGVKNVVVWLRPDNQDPKAKFAADEVHPADAKRGRQDAVMRFTARLVFEPRVLIVRPGDTVVAQNQSPLPTNVQWVSTNNGVVNVPLAPGGRAVLAAPVAAETQPITFRSNVVPAVATLRVFDHPYYAVTDTDGQFELKNAPAGRYRLAYWHETQGFKGGAKGRFGERVEIAPGKDGTMALPPVAFDVTK